MRRPRRDQEMSRLQQINFFFQMQKIAARFRDMSYIVSAGVLEKADSGIENL